MASPPASQGCSDVVDGPMGLVAVIVMFRCALYLRALAHRGERLELFPAAVYPEAKREWMLDHVADVLQADGG